MFLTALFVLALICLGVMERKGIIDDGEFAVAVVLLLSAAGGYLGMSNY